MLLDKYSSEGFLQVTSVFGKTSESDKFAFRGDLILKEGELREGSERAQDRKPPEFVIHQSVILTSPDKLLLVSGLLYELSTLTIFVDKFRNDLTADTELLLYVENISEKMTVEYQGMTFKLLPYSEGMIWNELLDTLYIEKSDLKGLSAEDKVATVYEECKDFDTKTAAINLEEALENTFVVEKDLVVGPV